MMSREQNDYLTRTAKGEPAGELLRRYWLPAALTDELAGDRPLVPVTLLGESLVLFRNESGEPGLIQRHCPHRGADLVTDGWRTGGFAACSMAGCSTRRGAAWNSRRNRKAAECMKGYRYALIR